MGAPAFVPLRAVPRWSRLGGEAGDAPAPVEAPCLAEAPSPAEDAPAPEDAPAAEPTAGAGRERATELEDRERAREHAEAVAELERLQARERAAAERLGELAAEFARLRDGLVQEMRAHTATLVLQLARRVAGEGLRTQPELLDAMVRDAIDALGPGEVLVRVSPEDEPRVRATLTGSGVRVEADPSVAAGCVSKGALGTIDASLDTAMASAEVAVRAWSEG